MLSRIFCRRGISQSCVQLNPPRFVDLLSSTNLKPQLSPNYNRNLENARSRKDAQTGSLVKRYVKKLKEEKQQQVNSASKEEEAKSHRQQFRELPYSKSVLEKIEKEKMGKVTKLKVAKNSFPESDPNAPRDKDPEALRKLISKFSFVAAAKVKESLPPIGEKEIAFVGRSNVGKSSLINALTQGGLARVSDKPGKTQSINFYRMEKSNKYLVDLPGYGFAYGKEEVVEDWNKLVEYYVTERKSLVRLFVLIDSRHGLKFVDRKFLDALNSSSTRYQVILTKCDQVTPIDLARRENQIKDELRSARRNAGDPILVSSVQKGGLSKLRRIVSSLLQV